MKRLEDDGEAKIFIDPETRDLLGFYTGEKRDLGMNQFLKACDEDLKEAKYGPVKSQKHVSELTMRFNELQRQRDQGTEDENLPFKDKINNCQIQCAYTTAVNKPK